MIKVIRAVITMVLIVSLLGITCVAAEDSEETKQKAYEYAWNHMTEEEQYNASLDIQAWSVGLSVEEFSLCASVVEAESDRSYYNDGETTDGRIAVAVCIWCRIYSDSFPNSVYGVLTAAGQFTTVSGGTCYTKYTSASRWAIIKGYEQLLDGTYPNNLYWFNCISFFSGHYAYQKIGDNYFSTSGEPTYYSNAFIIKTTDGLEIREIHKMSIEEELEYLKSKEDN